MVLYFNDQAVVRQKHTRRQRSFRFRVGQIVAHMGKVSSFRAQPARSLYRSLNRGVCWMGLVP